VILLVDFGIGVVIDLLHNTITTDTLTHADVTGDSHQIRPHGTSKGYKPMLVLSRKKNESIVINNDITVTVVEIRGDKVRLGIVAPKEVPVHRQEVYDAIHGDRQSLGSTIVVLGKSADATNGSL
jgi:carbon storage regulator